MRHSIISKTVAGCSPSQRGRRIPKGFVCLFFAICCRVPPPFPRAFSLNICDTPIVVHLKLHAQPAFVLDISDHWQTKREAIACFHSQFVEGRESLQPGFIDRLEYEARYWGQSIGVEFGEPYTSREPIGLRDWASLI